MGPIKHETLGNNGHRKRAKLRNKTIARIFCAATRGDRAENVFH